MKTTAHQRNIHVSARKMRLVIDLIRNKDVTQALNILSFTDKKSAPIVAKLLNSAIANAINNHAMNADKLYIYEILANEGPTWKRTLPRAKGSADRLRKRTTHLSITLSDDRNEPKVVSLKKLNASKAAKAKYEANQKLNATPKADNQITSKVGA